MNESYRACCAAGVTAVARYCLRVWVQSLVSHVSADD
jgi:hypothetical protein